MGRTLAAATFAIATLAATSLMAQQSQEQKSQEQSQQSSQQQAAAQQIPAGAHSIIGKKVMGQDGKELGEINDVVVSEQGKIEALVIERGGGLTGGKTVAVKWDSVKMQGDQVSLQMNDQQLSELPEYKTDK